MGYLFKGGVLIIDKFLSLYMVIWSVFGIGVVDKVRVFIFILIFLIFFLCWILKCCFLLIINKFKFLKIMLLFNNLCVLIIILI